MTNFVEIRMQNKMHAYFNKYRNNLIKLFCRLQLVVLLQSLIVGQTDIVTLTQEMILSRIFVCYIILHKHIIPSPWCKVYNVYDIT